MRVFLTRPAPDFLITMEALREVREYLPVLAVKKKLSAAEMTAIVNLLPLHEHPRDAYAAFIPKARQLIGHRDPDDVETLALALTIDAPIWTNDRDFENTGITTYTTAAILTLLEGS